MGNIYFETSWSLASIWRVWLDNLKEEKPEFTDDFISRMLSFVIIMTLR